MDITRASGALGAGSIPAGGTVFVYALANNVNQKIYVGISQNVSRRLKEHNSGRNRYTKAFVPWRVIYTEPHPNFASARKREKYFKSYAGKAKLPQLIKD